MNPNPYRAALGAMSIVAILVGVILFIAGAVAANAVDYSLYSRDDPLKGVAQLIWGGGFFALGAIAGLLWLAVGAITHKPAAGA